MHSEEFNAKHTNMPNRSYHQVFKIKSSKEMMVLELLQFQRTHKHRILSVHNLNLGEGFCESAYS